MQTTRRAARELHFRGEGHELASADGSILAVNVILKRAYGNDGGNRSAQGHLSEKLTNNKKI